MQWTVSKPQSKVSRLPSAHKLAPPPCMTTPFLLKLAPAVIPSFGALQWLAVLTSGIDSSSVSIMHLKQSIEALFCVE